MMQYSSTSFVSIMTTVLLITSALLSASTYAQSASPEVSSNEEALDNLQAQRTQSEVLRLEDTIRANREQPQVLTIVPWQLPSHQRIDESKAWQPVVDKLPNIERNQFLRELAVVDEILTQSGSAVQAEPEQNNK